MALGRCICEAVTVTVDGDPKATYTCFCSDCRKNSGHLGQLGGQYDTSRVTIRDPMGWVRTFEIAKTKSGHPKTKVFCGQCGCHVAMRPGGHDGKLTNVRLTLLDEFRPEYAPQEKYMEDAKQGYLKQEYPNFV